MHITSPTCVVFAHGHKSGDLKIEKVIYLVEHRQVLEQGSQVEAVVDRQLAGAAQRRGPQQPGPAVGDRLQPLVGLVVDRQLEEEGTAVVAQVP